MRIHYLQHVPFEGPAYLETIARAGGASIAGTRLYEGEALPAPSGFDLLAVMGGPMGVHDERIYPWLAGEKRAIGEAIEAGKIVIGICLGAQLIADVMGASVHKNEYREIGWFPVTRSSDALSTGIDRLFPERFQAFHWHGDTFDIPNGAVRLGESEACRNQGFVYDERIVALQFHLEATPKSVRALLDNCRDELDGSRFVQSEKDIANDTHFAECNGLFTHIMKALGVL
ncbi:MAG TPA: type 1 glutamine amidotransferase [Spirochaetota bacterium]|mgnify:CR=1 FL=1|nr:type 1 glutamine amidotransferase [Spirochaetota bacterium]HPL15677.1 type 1 glutamine amidotransferase [Spirochaetota bacterium]HQF09302.1 type 1 glutamine amidotransferase [Spirochaetota bacterium]HQH98250.1 type 1 glutamine amidotransferase [Spirochaetota bacterium]HQJ70409.1 type 1 glutamine amidotransferase [Spirochaetota bacterium]